jgi:hypothetical protein
MQTLRIEVSNSIYEHILFFLQNLPKNLINISHETKPTVASKKSLENRSLRGVFQSYADPQKQLLESEGLKIISEGKEKLKPLAQSSSQDGLDFSSFKVEIFKQIDGLEYQKGIRDEW